MARKGHSETFNNLLLEAIDEAFSSLGESVKKSLFAHLKGQFNMKRSEIPSKIMQFSNALEQIFGIGAHHLELLFMRNLHAELQLACKWPTWCKWVIPEVTFQEYVELMRHKFEETNTEQLGIEVYVNAEEKNQQYV